MARYIDVEKADLKTIHTSYMGYSNEADIIDWLNSQPTAAVEEVVRCKDCKHFEPHGNGKRGICRHPKLKTYIKYDNDFCSYGERRNT